MNRNSKKTLKVLIFTSGALLLVLLIIYMGGFLTPGKIAPGRVKKLSLEPSQPRRTGRAEIQRITEFYEAVGTVRPRTEINIEAQLTGRVLKVLVRPGDNIPKGKLLIVLDSREFRARVDQVKQGLTSAQAQREQAKHALLAARAAYTQAESAYIRIKGFVESEAATKQDLEQAESAYLQAKAKVKQAEDGLKGEVAGVNRAKKVVEESTIALDHNKIRAPENGQVVKRLAEPGDLAWPGKPLMVLQTRKALRLEALVREGLIQKMNLGRSLEVYINALDRTMEGKVEEVIPSADPTTRTFLVKVSLTSQKDLFPGMFGRLLVPIMEKEVVVAPYSAIRRMGQLEVALVEEKGEWREIFVKTGRLLTGDKVEILSGLKGDEILALSGGADV